MKHRFKLAAIPVVISIVGVVGVLVQNHRSPKVFLVSMSQPTEGKAQSIEVATPSTQPADSAPLVVVEPAIVQDKTGVTTHVARRGETLDSMAADFRGKDARAYRAAIVEANPSLQADPDKLIAGKTYVIPSSTGIAAAPATPAVVDQPAAQTQDVVVVHSEPANEMKYTANAGDTVTNMSAAFLGSEDKAHQDTIINANASLKANPDKVIVGKAYTIPAPDGLTATASSSSLEPQVRPTVQPDADQLVATTSTRTLRYTARAGDTVTSMAIALLGSDTLAARTAIVDSNPSLKLNPDRVIAGETYSIPAPTPAVAH